MAKQKMVTEKGRELIINHLNENGKADKDELIELVQDEVILPNDEELRRRYCGVAVNKIIAKQRDNNGVREILGRHANGGTEYIAINTCRDIEKLQTIDDKLMRNIHGLNKTQHKVSKRLGVLKGQLTMEFMRQRESGSLLAQETAKRLSK